MKTKRSFKFWFVFKICITRADALHATSANLYVNMLYSCCFTVYSPPPLKKQRLRGYKEDPFIFLTSDVDIWPKIK